MLTRFSLLAVMAILAIASGSISNYQITNLPNYQLLNLRNLVGFLDIGQFDLDFRPRMPVSGLRFLLAGQQLQLQPSVSKALQPSFKVSVSIHRLARHHLDA